MPALPPSLARLRDLVREGNPAEAFRIGREMLDAGDTSVDTARLTATASARLGRPADTVAILAPILAEAPDNTACLARQSKR